MFRICFEFVSNLVFLHKYEESHAGVKPAWLLAFDVVETRGIEPLTS